MDALSKVQVPDDVLNQMTSITEVQTKGIKRLRETDDNDDEIINQLSVGGIKKKIVINSIAGSKRKHLLENDLGNKLYAQSDPNIVGFEVNTSYNQLMFLL